MPSTQYGKQRTQHLFVYTAAIRCPPSIAFTIWNLFEYCAHAIFHMTRTICKWNGLELNMLTVHYTCCCNCRLSHSRKGSMGGSQPAEKKINDDRVITNTHTTFLYIKFNFSWLMTNSHAGTMHCSPNKLLYCNIIFSIPTSNECYSPACSKHYNRNTNTFLCAVHAKLRRFPCMDM